MITDISQLDPTKQYTYADYLTWQFEEKGGAYKGLDKQDERPLSRHQKISGNFFVPIHLFLKNKPCEVYHAPFDVRLVNKRKSRPDNTIYSVVQPDIVVVCDTEKIDAKGCVGAPDWIIEILSPSNSKKEVKQKFSLYEENGVLEYWIVYPDQEQVEVFDLVNDKFTFRSYYTKGDQIPVGIFEGVCINSEEVF